MKRSCLERLSACISDRHGIPEGYVLSLAELAVVAGLTLLATDAARAALSRHESSGSYFVMQGYQYDPALTRHFVIGDVHTVSDGKDSAVSYVFEYEIRFENYRLVVDDAISYTGDRPHNSEWIKANKE